MEIDKSQLVRFFLFIHERQSIWHRRRVEGQDYPWTDDEILSTYKFCNVYRELDRGTQYYLDLYENKLKDEDRRTLLLNTVLYRFFNVPNFFENVLDGKLVGPVFQHEWKWFEKKLDQKKEEGVRMFSDAYTTCQMPFDPDYRKSDKHVQILLRLKWLAENMEEVGPRVFDSQDPKEAFKGLQEVKHVGPFLAYEIWTDLSYTEEFPWTDDDFVNIGPGAKWGLKLMTDGKVTRYNPVCEQIRDVQKKYFSHLSVVQGKKPWEEIAYADAFSRAPYLSLRNIEHSLCEYRKYWRLKEGEGRKRYFHKYKEQRDAS